MDRRTDQERLLQDVLAEESDAGFHSALLSETLRLARQRRRGRTVKRIGGAVAGMVAILVVLLVRIPRPPVSAPVAAPRSYEMILSQLLPAANVITTRPLEAELVVVSSSSVAVIRSTNMLYRELGDDELLALVPQPVALVRRGPHDVELVFVNLSVPDDAGRN